MNNGTRPDQTRPDQTGPHIFLLTDKTPCYTALLPPTASHPFSLLSSSPLPPIQLHTLPYPSNHCSLRESVREPRSPGEEFGVPGSRERSSAVVTGIATATKGTQMDKRANQNNKPVQPRHRQSLLTAPHRPCLPPSLNVRLISCLLFSPNCH